MIVVVGVLIGLFVESPIRAAAAGIVFGVLTGLFSLPQSYEMAAVLNVQDPNPVSVVAMKVVTYLVVIGVVFGLKMLIRSVRKNVA